MNGGRCHAGGHELGDPDADRRAVNRAERDVAEARDDVEANDDLAATDRRAARGDGRVPDVEPSGEGGLTEVRVDEAAGGALGLDLVHEHVGFTLAVELLRPRLALGRAVADEVDTLAILQRLANDPRYFPTIANEVRVRCANHRK